MLTIGSEERDVSLYFHIPFCSKKCPYCHFFVIPDTAESKAPFIQALILELQMRMEALRGKRIVSLYFGGGTPTKITAEEYAPLFAALYNSFLEIDPDCEITLEANPEDVSLERMKSYRALGFNRLSVGLQSLQPSELITLGRNHSAERAVDALHAAEGAGFKQISVDLMFELPGQTLSSWKQTLGRLSLLPITHLSLYNLTIEPRTLFFKHRSTLEPQRPSDEERLQMLQYAIDYLPTIGLERYEISAFARNNAYSRHNTGYWIGRPFFGIGPSAFSFFEGERFSNCAHLGRYLETVNKGNLPVDFKERLPYPQNLQELLAVELRLCEGIDLARFTQRNGPLPENFNSTCETLVERGWVEKIGSQIRLTPQGQLFYDSVAVALI